MKKTYKIIALSALALLIAIPAMAQTGNGDDSNQLPPPPPMMQDDQGGQPGMMIPGHPGQQGDSENGGPGPGIRARMRADINTRVENAQNNEDIRNMMLERDMMASGTPPMRDDRGPRPFMASSSMIMGSTTMRDRFEGDQGDDRRGMRMDMFEERKRIVTKSLDIAIDNLNNISSRLYSRIQKEQTAGHDMTDAVNAFDSANAKITIASNDVAALEAYLSSATSTADASTTVDLDTARSMTSAAQSAVKDAQKSLNDVVVAIAHELGLKLEADEHIEASSTASVTSQ